MIGHPKYSKEEIAERARAVYENNIRAKVEPEYTGKYLVIDIESGEYEIDDDYLAATTRAARKHPGAPLHAMRVGYSSLGHIGFAPKASNP